MWLKDICFNGIELKNCAQDDQNLLDNYSEQLIYKSVYAWSFLKSFKTFAKEMGVWSPQTDEKPLELQSGLLASWTCPQTLINPAYSCLTAESPQPSRPLWGFDPWPPLQSTVAGRPNGLTPVTGPRTVFTAATAPAGPAHFLLQHLEMLPGCVLLSVGAQGFSLT